MPYPKKRKNPAGDTSEKRQKVNGTDMLRRTIATVQAGSNAAARNFGHTFRSASNSAISHATDFGRDRSGEQSIIFGARSQNRGSTKGKQKQVFNRSAQRPRDRPSSRASQTNVRAKQSRRQASFDIYNEEFIYNNFDIPKAAEYGLTTEPIDNCLELLKDANLLSKKESRTESEKITRYARQCLYSIELNEEVFIAAKGHGKSKSEAERNAALHAICLLHQMGHFKDVLPGGKYTSASPSSLAAQKSAKKDVIDYAALHDCIPTFETHSSKSKLKNGSLVVTKASIAQLGLEGYGRARATTDSMLQAAISLKQAVEVYHGKTGEGLLLVKDYTKLTTASARQFVDFFCSQRSSTYEIALKQTKSVWSSTINIKANSEEQGRSFNGIDMHLKKDAEDTVFLAAALALKQEDKDLWKMFVKEMKRGNGQILKSVMPIRFEVNYEAIKTMQQTIRDAPAELKKQSANIEETQLAVAGRKHNASRSRQFSKALSDDLVQAASQRLKDKLERYRTDPTLSTLRDKRAELPMAQYRKKLIQLVSDNEVCVVVGATGSGKTTQLPQIILDDMIEAGRGGHCNIICTQPRRIAAISVAQRVSVERNESLQQSVGYSVRFDNKSPTFGGSINFCTTGILLRQMQESQDQTLDGISHLIIDEVHERDIQIDFLLVVLRQIMADRKARGLPSFKIVLMSATIDTDLFCKYFGTDFKDGRCPYISVPGRTFPVTSHYLDEFYPLLTKNYTRSSASELYSKDTQMYINRELVHPPDLSLSMPVSEVNSAAEDDEDERAMINWQSKGIVHEDGQLDLNLDLADTVTPVGLMSVVIAHILKTTSEGSILVFLPGLQEITALNRILTTTRPIGIDFANAEDYKIYTLHSAIPQMQQEVFEQLPPGKRKIILSTNIAETSITIPDVVYVVDSGKHRQSQYSPATRISRLISTWTSKSNAKQRAGRAGRVQHGHYYTMATEARYESLEIAALPEILRTDLQELCLQIKSMGVEDIGKFLQSAIEPPPASSVEAAIDQLQALKALDDAQNLTSLGQLLSTLPVAPSLGKMVILGAIFKCLDPILILAVAATSREIFLSPAERRSAADEAKASFAQNTGSDHAAIINAFTQWRSVRAESAQAEREFVFDKFLHRNTLISIAQTCEQILDIMQKTGLVARPQGRRPQRFSTTQYGSEEENVNSESLPLQTALATAGLYPNLAVQTSNPRLLRTAHDNAAQIHIGSLAAPKSDKGRYGPISYKSIQPAGTLFTFSSKTQADGNDVQLRGVTKTLPLAVILFGSEVSFKEGILTVDGWIPFREWRGTQLSVVKDMNQVLSNFLQTTFAKLGVANSQRVLNRANAAEGAWHAEPSSQKLLQGVVEAIETSASSPVRRFGNDQSTFRARDSRGFQPSSSSRGRKVDASDMDDILDYFSVRK